MTLSSIWNIVQVIDTILAHVKRVRKAIGWNLEKKVVLRPRSPILGSEENGEWVFRWGGKEYNTGESTLIHEIGYEGTPYHFEKRLYRTNKKKKIFIVQQNHFFGEYSKIEVQVLLDANRAPKEAYEKAGIKLENP